MPDAEHAAILAAIADLKADTEALRKVLIGNGNWEHSLVAKFSRLSASVETCQARSQEKGRDEVSSRRAYIIAGISAGVAIIGAVISLLF